MEGVDCNCFAFGYDMLGHAIESNGDLNLAVNVVLLQSPDKSDPSEPIYNVISKDLAPVTIAVCKQIHQHAGQFILKALFDSGSTMATMINRRVYHME